LFQIYYFFQNFQKPTISTLFPQIIEIIQFIYYLFFKKSTIDSIYSKVFMIWELKPKFFQTP
jgi:hypothetical protein